MEMSRSAERFVRPFAKGCAWTVFLFGVFFFICWQTGLYAPLYSPFLDWPIPYSAVIAITLAGFGFLNVIYAPHLPLYRWVGAAMLTIAGIKLSEMLFNVDLGLSPLLQKTLLSVPPEFPPMVLVGAVNFSLIGLVLFFWPRKERTAGFSSFSTLVSILLIFVSLQAVVIYFLPIQSAELTRQLPIHYYSAALQAVFALGWFSWNIHLDLVQNIKITKWIPSILVAAILFLHTFFVIAFIAQSKQLTRQSVATEIRNIEYLIQTQVTELENALVRQKSRIEFAKEFELNFLSVDANRYLRDEPAVQRIGWLNDRFETLKSIPREGANGLILQVPEEIQIEILKKGSSSDHYNYFDQSNLKFVCLAPIYWDGKLQGASFFQLDLGVILQEVEKEIGFKGYLVELFFDETKLYQYPVINGHGKNYAVLSSPFSISSVPFVLRATLIEMLPVQSLGRFLLTSVSIAVLIGAIISGIALYLFQQMKEKTLLLEKSSHELIVSFELMKVMNKALTIHEASGAILEILNREYGWELFLYWGVDSLTNQLTLLDANTIPTCSFPNFESASRTLSPGPNVVTYTAFEKRIFVWSKDFGNESFQRSPAAKKDGIRGGIAIPVYEKGIPIGVLELYKRAPLEKLPEEDWLNFIAGATREFSRFILRNEAELANSELAAMVNSAPVAAYTLDQNYRIERWNPAAESLYGWKASEMYHKDVRELFPPHRASDQEKLMQVYQKKTRDIYYQTERLKKDKTLIPVGVYYSPILDENGNLNRVLVITRDISEQVRVERAKDEFISMVSHELRTPLTSIIGAIGLLKGMKEWPQEVNELILLASRNSARLGQLIDDIMDLEKIQLNRFELKLQPIVIADAIHEAVLSSSIDAEDNQISLIEREIIPGIKIQGDYNRLVQVFLNLLSNAIKFSLPGNNVFIQMEKRENRVKISVEDKGTGIDESIRPIIWDKFTKGLRGDTKTKGSGLGLNITKNLVERMGGTIGFTTELNVGSTFYVEFSLISDN